MDILFVGGAGNITNAFMGKLNKEGHRISVLTGKEIKVDTYKNVFERYDFTYESNSIKEILESANPDVIIFMGAYDTNFDWTKPREEAVRFSAGLLNVLMAYSLLKCGRFIFLSSDIVFNRAYPDDIREEEPTTARDFRAMALQQGEELCRNYQTFEELDITILRMDHLCAVPTGRREAVDPCSRMCVEAVRYGRIQASGKNIFSLLYINDAAEFLLRFISADHHAFPLYHLSSGQAVDELELARMVKERMNSDDVAIQNNTVGEQYRIVLSNKRFFDEFQVTIFNDTEKTVRHIADYVKRHKNRFLEDEDEGMGFWGRLSQGVKTVFRAVFPFLENLVCFIPFFMLNNRAVGSAYFSKLDFYLLYVLLFAIVYGQQQATFSAILAVAGYCFRQMYTRSGFEVLMDYNTYVWVAQLFIIGLVVGYMRDQLTFLRKERADDERYFIGQLDDIQNINTSNVRIKNVLEEQLVNHNQSVGKIYEITSQLDRYAPEEVMFYAAEMVGRLLDSRDVAIYSVANGSYARLFSSTSSKARQLGNSVKYDEMPCYGDLAKRDIYINKELVEPYPMLADAIYEGDQMQLIIMVWGVPWERMNLSLANLLTVVGYLIQNAVLRANRYQKALEDQRYVHGTNILGAEAFTSLVKAYEKASYKGLTECAVIHLNVEDKKYEETAAEIARLLRRTDYMGFLEDGELYVLLSNTNAAGGQIVLQRFEEVGYNGAIVEDLNLS